MSLYHQAVQDRQRRYELAVKAGLFDPFVYPGDSLSALLLFLAVVLIPSLPLHYRKSASRLAFGLIAYLSFDVFVRTRSLNFAGGYGIGLASTWGVLMTAVLLLINDPRTDFVRLERRTSGHIRANQVESEVNGHATGSDVHSAGVADRREKSRQATTERASGVEELVDDPVYSEETIWAPFPTSLRHRFDWAFDLLTSFRGPNWNFRIPPMPKMLAPPAPPGFHISPRFITNSTEASPTEPTLATVRYKAIRSFIRDYLLIDLLKTIMITDPYFLGRAPLQSVSPWPFLSQSTVLAKCSRLLISVIGVPTALNLIFSLSPLFFAEVLPTLFPGQLLDKITYSPLLHPLLYPSLWHASFLDMVSSRNALATLWGRAWHQMFRFGISEPSRAVLGKYHIDSRSVKGRAIQLCVAFGLTATLHASASYTTFPAAADNPPRPLSGPFLFFLLQLLGIALNAGMLQILPTSHSVKLRRCINTTFLFLWSYFVGPLLADDFARCGIWMFEPVPVSLLRPLLLDGTDGKGGWFAWRFWEHSERWCGWWDAQPWWRRGIAVY